MSEQDWMPLNMRAMFNRWKEGKNVRDLNYVDCEYLKVIDLADARIRELEAALDKLAGQNPIRHFENGDCCHCGAFLSDDEPHEIDCPWIRAINILSRNEAQEGRAHGQA